MAKLGQAYVTRYWYLNYPAGDFPSGAKADNVHFQEMGAIEMARLVAEGIKELTTDANVSKLIPFLKPQYEIAVSANPIGSDQLTTRTASYPQGLTVTLRTVAKTGKTFQRWSNAANTSIATTYLTKVTSGATATSYKAIYAGAVLGVEEELDIDKTTLYPNPFTNEFQLNVKGHFQYSIFTMEGIEIEQGKGENTLTMGSQLNIGFYVLKIESASGNKVIKITKNQ